MKLNNKILYLTTAGVMATLNPANTNAQTFYQCMPLSCKDGQYIKDGKCTSCPAGTYQSGNDRATSCSPCPSGKYSGAGATSCTTCEAGNYCSGGLKYACGAGKYSGAGATSCSTCGAGQTSTAGASSCSTCSNGTYASNNTCVSCPAGSRCSDGIKYTCSAGTFSASGATSCSSCSAGQYQNEAGKSSCKSCSAGQISGTGAISCTTCAEGKYASNNTCVTCEAGSYCTGGIKYECEDGTYALAGASSCKTCTGTITETCRLSRNYAYTGGCKANDPILNISTSQNISFTEFYTGYLECTYNRLYTEKNITRDDKATWDFVNISRTAKLSAKPDVDIISSLNFKSLADKYQYNPSGGCSIRVKFSCDKKTGQVNGFKSIFSSSDSCQSDYSYTPYDSAGGSSVCVKKVSF